MALVVLLRGLNVGGHRTVRPTMLAKRLRHLDAVNIGATGVLVVRKRVSRAQLRAEVTRRIPFEADVMICEGREVVRLVSKNFFDRYPVRPDIVRFVSVLSRPPRSAPQLPLYLPSNRGWMVTVLAREGRFVVGLYRRQMKVIGYLGKLDRVFGAPLTTRSWGTFTTIAKVLNSGT